MEFNVENYLSNLSYINKDFEAIWDEILETVPKLTNKWKPNEANESDPLVVLLKELAIIADKLNYNIDKNILELFPSTLTQERSAHNVYESLGYSPDWYVSAITNVTLTYNGMVGDSLPTNISGITVNTTTVTLPQFTTLSNNDQTTTYVTLAPVNIYVGIVKNYTVPAIEGTINDFEINGSTQITSANLDSQNRLYFTENNIAQNGIFISYDPDFTSYSYIDENDSNINDTTAWLRVDNLNQYMAGSRVYKLGVDAVTNSIYIQFPDDIGNLIQNGIYIKYILSSGEEGNVGKGDITSFLNDIYLEISGTDTGDGTTATITNSNITINNTQATQNGSDPLDIDEMRSQFNRIVGVFDTLVSLRDYENYIYEYEYSTGDNIVSNIKVSDRYNDLYDTLTYITMDTESGDMSETTSVISNNNEALMTAYDLRLYPLYPVESINNKNDFDATFNLGEALPNDHLNILQDNIEDMLNDSGVKCISHDFVPPRDPIRVNYDLEGQIYLQSVVSSTEAASILSSVEQKLFKTLNARELNWGEMLDYGTVVDNIKAADDRIQYVALNAINYNSTDDSNVTTDFNIIVRNILAGNKAWTEFSPFSYNYNQIDTTTYPSNNNQITSIQTTIYGNGTSTITGNAYLVNKNETLSILIPQYNQITQYGNYLYYLAIGTGTIPSNTPTKLAEGQTIYFFNTRDEAENAKEESTNNALNNAPYKITSGSIITASAQVEFGAKNTVAVINMGSSITITTLEKATGKLTASNNYSTGSNEYNLYVATNSNGLVEAFKTNDGQYTLLSNEYLFYTDIVGAELGIIGEGTTLQLEGIGINNLYKIDNNSEVSNLVDGSRPSNYMSWTQISSANGTSSGNIYYSREIKYTLNKLYTFGENYLIEFGTYNNEQFTITKDNITFTPNIFTPLSNITAIRYQLLTHNEDGSYTTSDQYEYLSSLLSGDEFQYLIRYSLVTGPGIEQEIAALNATTLNSIKTNLNSGINIAATSQSIVVNYNGGTSVNINKSTSANSTYIQSSMLISYQGGSELNISANEANLSLISYGVDNVINISAKGFTTFNNLLGNNISGNEANITIPGNTSSCALLGLLGSNNPYVPDYYIIRSNINIGLNKNDETWTLANINGTTTDFSNLNYTAITIPKIANINAIYYNSNTSSNANLNSLLTGADNASLDYVKLGTDQIYNLNYCPMYEPDPNNIIPDPTLPNTYFLSQHPYNKYSIPHLNSYANLIISPLSITQ